MQPDHRLPRFRRLIHLHHCRASVFIPRIYCSQESVQRACTEHCLRDQALRSGDQMVMAMLRLVNVRLTLRCDTHTLIYSVGRVWDGLETVCEVGQPPAIDRDSGVAAFSRTYNV